MVEPPFWMTQQQVIMFAERKVWSQVTIMVHKKVSLADALKNIVADSLFWQTEVLQRISSKPGKGMGKTGGGQGFKKRKKFGKGRGSSA